MDAFSVSVLFVVALLAFFLGVFSGEEDAMREALDRGYAVQCVGKSGIYWECE